MKNFTLLFKILLIFFTVSCIDERSDSNSGASITPPKKITITVPNSVTVAGVAGGINPTTNSIKLSWTSYTASATKGYKISVYNYDTTCLCPSSLVTSKTSLINILETSILGLVSEASYFIKVEAINSNNETIEASSSDFIPFQTLIPGGLIKPSKPLISSITVTRRTALIKWIKSTDTSDITGSSMVYTLKVKDSSGTPIQTFTNLNVLEKNITGLDPGNTYTYEIFATNANLVNSSIVNGNQATVPSLEINNLIATPGTSNLTEDELTADEVSLSWNISNTYTSPLIYQVLVDGVAYNNFSPNPITGNTIKLNNLIPSSPKIFIPPLFNRNQIIKTYRIKIKVTDTSDNSVAETQEVIVTMNFSFSIYTIL